MNAQTHARRLAERAERSARRCRKRANQARKCLKKAQDKLNRLLEQGAAPEKIESASATVVQAGAALLAAEAAVSDAELAFQLAVRKAIVIRDMANLARQIARFMRENGDPTAAALESRGEGMLFRTRLVQGWRVAILNDAAQTRLWVTRGGRAMLTTPYQGSARSAALDYPLREDTDNLIQHLKILADCRKKLEEAAD